MLELSDFLLHHEEHIERLRKTRAPGLVTVEGKGDLVLQDAEAYRALINRLRELEDLLAVREGVLQAEAGQTRPAQEFFSEFMGQRGIEG